MTMRSLTESELEVVSGGGGSADTSETFSGSGSGTVSGPAAGRTDPHSGGGCPADNMPCHFCE